MAGLAESANVPGYLRAVREFSCRCGYRGALNALDLLSAADAEHFLGPKLDAIEDSFRHGTEGQETALDVIFAFAVMLVHADRQEREALEALVGASPPKADGDFNVDAALEHDQTRPDISW